EYIQGTIRGGNRSKEHRVGLKLNNGGWIYVLGLTHYVVNEDGEFIMHGINAEGKLASALEISTKPFTKYEANKWIFQMRITCLLSFHTQMTKPLVSVARL